ncbi:MAG: tetratricopeptide repeat protein [Acidobacteria bacterium]|nr:tetratricopeptide repeat protein [Acidobacteriota bacterium]
MGKKQKHRRPKINSHRAATSEPTAAHLQAEASAKSNRLSSLLQPLRKFSFFSNTTPDKGTEKTETQLSNLPSRILKAGVTFLTVALITVITSVLFLDVFKKDTVVIEPFHISSELQSKGYNDELVAGHIAHQISVMIREMKSIKRSQGFDLPLSTKLPDIQVPATNVSAKNIMRYIQEFPPLRSFKRSFGLNPIRVEGQVLLLNEEVKIDLRIEQDNDGDQPAQAKTFTGNVKNIEPLFVEISQYIMSYAEPYLWAVYLYQKKRPDESLAQIQNYLHQNSADNADMALSLWGLILLDQEKYDEAIAKFEEATKSVGSVGKKRELVAAYNNWGLALLHQHKIAEAMSKFDEAIQHDPNHALTYNNYAKALLERKQNKEAIEKLKQALRLDPNLAAAYYNKAYAVAEEKPEDAIALYLTAINIDQNFAEAYNRLGLLLADGIEPPRMKEAFEKLNKAIELNPNYAYAYTNRALAWAKQGNFKKAIADAEEAVRLYEKQLESRRGDNDFVEAYARAYNNLGWYYEEEGEFDRAVVNYEKAIKINPKYFYAYVGKGDALLKAKRFDDALAAYEFVTRQPEADERSRFAAYEAMGLVFSERSRHHALTEKREDIELAISMFNEALIITPNAKEVLDKLAKAKHDLSLIQRKAK